MRAVRVALWEAEPLLLAEASAIAVVEARWSQWQWQ
jgi:hypothetical protein